LIVYTKNYVRSKIKCLTRNDKNWAGVFSKGLLIRLRRTSIPPLQRRIFDIPLFLPRETFFYFTGAMIEAKLRPEKNPVFHIFFEIPAC
jgi:hypothetical protein